MSRPDRVAMWAVFLCLLLVVAAAASARAAEQASGVIVHAHVSAVKR